MDAPDLDPAVYAAVLRDLARVNAVTLAARPTLAFLRRLEPAMRRRGTPIRILDVGHGEGGMLRAISRHLTARGIASDLWGVDLNPRSAAIATAATPPGNAIRYRTGDYAELAGKRWDIVLSSLVLHHMREGECSDFLAFMEREAALGWFINDLHRSALAYHGFPILARLLRVHRIVREDGQLSIARSFRPAEWRKILSAAGLGDAAQIAHAFPFRLCVARVK